MLARVIRSLMVARLLVAVACVALLTSAGCRSTRPEVEQRTTQGPTAQQMFNLRVLAESGREPTFEERRQWDAQIEERIAAYLRAHPDTASSLDVSTFRFLRQSTVGMDKEQILILLGPPVAVSGDQAHLEQIARRYWPQIQGNATEVWIYPLGWSFFFSGQKVVDITQYVAPPK
jgi:hypothetical protein